jgi:hypothetical protein
LTLAHGVIRLIFGECRQRVKNSLAVSATHGALRQPQLLGCHAKGRAAFRASGQHRMN